MTEVNNLPEKTPESGTDENAGDRASKTGPGRAARLISRIGTGVSRREFDAFRKFQNERDDKQDRTIKHLTVLMTVLYVLNIVEQNLWHYHLL